MTPLRSWRRRALGPLWSLTLDEVRAQRLRALALLPLVLAAGLAFGFVLRRDGVMPLGYGIAIGVLGFGLLVFCGALLDTLLRLVFRADEGSAPAIAITLATDALLGAALGAVLADASRAQLYAAVALGAAFIPLYNLVVSQLIFGDSVEAVWRALYLSGPPAPPQHSRADALAARGLFDDAVSAVLAECHPPDAPAFARIGRMLRDGRRYHDAADWFRRAVVHARDPALEAQVARELCELYLHRLGSPGRAAPVLARLAERQAGSPGGEWARRELAALRARLHADGEAPRLEAERPGE